MKQPTEEAIKAHEEYLKSMEPWKPGYLSFAPCDNREIEPIKYGISFPQLTLLEIEWEQIMENAK